MAVGDVTVDILNLNSKLSAKFDGVDDRGTITGFPAFGTGNFTYSCWFRSSTSQTNRDLIGKGNWGGTVPVRACINQPSTTSISFLVGTKSASFGANLADGLWHFLVGVRTQTGIFTYTDGAYVSESLVAAENLTYNGVLNIGARHDTAGHWKGSIKDFKIWTKALDETERATVYAGGTVTDSLEAHYPLEENFTDIHNGYDAVNTGAVFTNSEGSIDKEFKNARVSANDIYLVTSSAGKQFITTHIEEV